jgi:hypothetical protein
MMQDRDLYELLERTSDAAFAVTHSGDIAPGMPARNRFFGFTEMKPSARHVSSCSPAATRCAR